MVGLGKRSFVRAYPSSLRKNLHLFRCMGHSVGLCFVFLNLYEVGVSLRPVDLGFKHSFGIMNTAEEGTME